MAEAHALLEWLALAERELLLFAAVFFLVGAFDEFALDLAWLRLRLTGRVGTPEVDRAALRSLPSGPAAVLVPAWKEAEVIGVMIAHLLAAWPQRDLRLYVGCYANDAATLEAAMQAAGTDARVRLVVLARTGPTTKADCLNRLYAALEADERRSNRLFRMVVLHDAEDMVDPAALGLFGRELAHADFVQLPVLPEAQPASRWIGSHYCEEFAEAHGKAMVVREALGAAMPAAGVGCAFSRRILAQLADQRGGQPFAVESLTEDYELGIGIKAMGGRTRFVRVRGTDGQLVATRACFPDRLEDAVRQKSRWVHGIALQGWERIGWPGLGTKGSVLETWMRLRDRRSLLSALVLLAAYLLLALSALVSLAGARPQAAVLFESDPVLRALLLVNFASFIWRAVMRFAFTAREYGAVEGLRAVLRIPLTNVIAIMAARRAMFAYVAALRRGGTTWEKTAHRAMPANAMAPALQGGTA